MGRITEQVYRFWWSLHFDPIRTCQENVFDFQVEKSLVAETGVDFRLQ
jgi:hypothetical protein